MSRPQIKRFRLLAHPGYHVRVVVWDTLEDMHRYSGRRGLGYETRQRGFFHYSAWKDGTRVLNKCRAGDLHCAKSDWDLNLVLHECLHAAFHLYAATLGPMVIEKVDTALDEPICYSIGKLADDVYKWLWEIAPNEKWSKSECRPSSCNE